MSPATCLPEASLTFLRDLARHNDREWFARNKARCDDDLVEPARALVRTLIERLATEFPEITGDDAKSGGSLTRLHRDVRFSKDKAPFHTHLGAHFWHRDGRKMEAPGFFLRVDAREVLLATGLHGPEKEPLARVRAAIDADRDVWTAAARGRSFVALWGGLDGASLQRVPAPWPADHPLAADLKRKDFTAFARLPASAATAPDFAETVLRHWSASRELMAFLCAALGLAHGAERRKG